MSSTAAPGGDVEVLRSALTTNVTITVLDTIGCLKQDFYPHDVGSRVCRVADDDGEARGRWKRGERFPLDLLGQD